MIWTYRDRILVKHIKYCWVRRDSSISWLTDILGTPFFNNLILTNNYRIFIMQSTGWWYAKWRQYHSWPFPILSEMYALFILALVISPLCHERLECCTIDFRFTISFLSLIQHFHITHVVTQTVLLNNEYIWCACITQSKFKDEEHIQQKRIEMLFHHLHANSKYFYWSKNMLNLTEVKTCFTENSLCISC